jgi:predicted signal transduction protein with EAL and GGDEF domain
MDGPTFLKTGTGIIMKPNTLYSRQQAANSELAGEQQRFLKNLSNAISQNELCLHYQPRYKCLTGQATVLEALVRWQRPDVGLLYPETFIAAAETHGLIYSLDIWVFEQCCKDLVWFHEHLDSSIKLAVNISVLSSESVYFSQKLIELCKQYQLSLSKLPSAPTPTTSEKSKPSAQPWPTLVPNFVSMISAPASRHWSICSSYR